MVQVPFAGPVESDDDNFTSHLHHFILYWISGNEFLMFFSSDLAVVKIGLSLSRSLSTLARITFVNVFNSGFRFLYFPSYVYYALCGFCSMVN